MEPIYSNTYALRTDRAGGLRNENIAKDFADTLEWTIKKLKATKPGEKVNLQDLYEDKMPNGNSPGDITLYLAFHHLLESNAAAGTSPYMLDEEGEKITNSHLDIYLEKNENTDKIESITRIYMQDYGKSEATPGSIELPRKLKLSYVSIFPAGNKAADEAFMLLNHPEPELETTRLGAPLANILQGYKGVSLSIGDIVESTSLDTDKTFRLRCALEGWAELEPKQQQIEETPDLDF